ncbi:hypothetical protein [Microcoleus sp. FACHB-672]|uniref:hypothetical protein n=1 Tax=Microcoleus sp. FACHB-672 TaxID=2692825 RepID=UPI0018EF48C2|nr:hypothetical protein [Microcoleus sp. FACHB-672]
MDRDALIAELQAAGVRHNPDEILQIAKKLDGSIVFLETGNDRSGWQHIRREHTEDFANRGIPEDQIQDAIMAGVTRGRIIGTQGTSRSVCEVVFNSETQYISVEVASNGYIVGANAKPKRLIRRFIEER